MDERFFTRLGTRVLGSPPEHVEKAPNGMGAASDWVIKRYPELMRRYPLRYPNENVALVVAVDGDNQGHRRRKLRFDEELSQRNMNPREERERVAICLPTWSVETWVACLCAWNPPSGPLDESRSFKLDVDRALTSGQLSLANAVENWSQTPPLALSSLDDARIEFRRALVSDR